MNATAADKQWFGHPRGLSTLFFTELWERLSYYGMRAILVLFMVDQIETGGFGMTDGKAAAIYGLYTAGVYLLALPGGWVADRILGQRQAVFYGGCVIAAGHFTMALPLIPGTEALSTFSFYAGLVLIVIGTGLLKPNVSAIVGDLYREKGARRDAGFSIFYMGINIGALVGPLLCGWLGEEIDWHLGFSAAGFGMLLGLVQYRLTEGHLGKSGLLEGVTTRERKSALTKLGGGAAAVMAAILVLVFLSGTLGGVEGIAQVLGYIIASIGIVYFGAVIFFGGLTSREKKRVFVIFLLFIGSALFWSGFEQAGSSMNLFAERHTDRTGPLISLVLGLSIIALAFAVVRTLKSRRVLAGWLAAELGAVAAIVAWQTGLGGLGAVGLGVVAFGVTFALGQSLRPSISRPTLLVLFAIAAALLVWWAMGPGEAFLTPASWLQSVNPMFIIIFAPVFGWLWVALGRREPSIPFKFGIGLVLLGVGFLVLASGSTLLDQNAAGVTPWWLIATYFLHTAGELCLSPVGLSSVTKLSPRRLVGQMMGTWFLGTALGNLIAGLVAGRIEDLPLPQLFGTVAIIVIVSGAVFVIFTIPIKKLIGNLEEDDEHPSQVPTDALDEAPEAHR